MSGRDDATREELLALVAEQARELARARQQQAVTAEVLQAINRADFDLDAVLSRLTQSASDLCQASTSALFMRIGDRLVARGTANLDQEQEAFVRKAAAPVDDTSYIGRAVLYGTIANVGDFLAESGSSLKVFQERLGFRALLVVPLMRDGEGIGVFTLARPSAGSFTPQQVELVQSFAAQAAIAAQSARQIDTLRERGEELTRSLGELAEAQERLARQTRLASLGRLVAGLSHELNTPVGSALTVSTSLEQTADELSNRIVSGLVLRSELAGGVARLKDGAILIRNNLLRAIGLVQRFRQLSSDQLDGAARSIEVRPWAEALLRNHVALADSGHQYGIECAEDLTVEGQPECWAQIVHCLIDNSLQHAFPNGRRGRIVLSMHGEEAALRLAYSDDGQGISSDHLSQVFEPFYTTARPNGAIGLGLHIVHNLVTSRGGQIAVMSEHGAGARFTISLPRG